MLPVIFSGSKMASKWKIHVYINTEDSPERSLQFKMGETERGYDFVEYKLGLTVPEEELNSYIRS